MFKGLTVSKVLMHKSSSGIHISIRYVFLAYFYHKKYFSVFSLLCLSTFSGAPRLLRPPRPGPCLNFGLQLTLSQPGGHIMPTTVLWALSGSNLPWHPCAIVTYYCFYYRCYLNRRFGPFYPKITIHT